MRLLLKEYVVRLYVVSYVALSHTQLNQNLSDIMTKLDEQRLAK